MDSEPLIMEIMHVGAKLKLPLSAAADAVKAALGPVNPMEVWQEHVEAQDQEALVAGLDKDTGDLERALELQRKNP